MKVAKLTISTMEDMRRATALPGSGLRFAKSAAYGLLPVIGILIFWEITTRLEIFPPIIFPPISAVASSLYDMTVTGTLLVDVAGTFRRLTISVVFGSVIGVALGAAMGYFGVVEKIVAPSLSFLLSIPGTAFFPLTMMWFGLNETAILVILVYEVVLTTALSTWSGVKMIEPTILNEGRSLGASGFSLFYRVLVPAALPSIITGFRLAFARAWRILIVAEMLVSLGNGLGYRLYWAREMFLSSQLYAGLFVVGLVGLLIERAFLRPLEVMTVQRWGTLRELD